MRSMYQVKCNVRKGMLCASCDAVGHVLRVTMVGELFGRFYVRAQSTRDPYVTVEGRDKDFVYRVTSPDLYARIVSGQFNPATGQ